MHRKKLENLNSEPVAKESGYLKMMCQGRIGDIYWVRVSSQRAQCRRDLASIPNSQVMTLD